MKTSTCSDETRCVVIYGDKYVNTPASRMEDHDGIVYVYDNENNLVGAFDIGTIDMIYLSGK